MNHIHILGIGGTFMAGLAVLAREAGYAVTGQDGPLYPPMSDVLADAGIEVIEGYAPCPQAEAADCVVIGNALSRGNPAVEAVLNRSQAYTSGPAWLARHILPGRWVIAVAGTHGKTTTASLIAWLLEAAGLEPGFLIGGLPGNFKGSARLGRAPFFVIEADEYDTAFFDKRSKFVHFGPRTLVLNNLEFDHADIFADLAAIERQFHHLIRTVPGNGAIIANADDPAIDRVLAEGCWSERIEFGESASADGRLSRLGEGWQIGGHAFAAPLPGPHNVMNTAAALLAARHAGLPLAEGIRALDGFAGVARRLQPRGEINDIQVLDDFAHHPTAIAATLSALREAAPQRRLLAVLEPRSNTMRAGVHGRALADALEGAEAVFMLTEPGLHWDARDTLAGLGSRLVTAETVTALSQAVATTAQPGDTIVVMSNGAFGGIHTQLLDDLKAQAACNGETA